MSGVCSVLKGLLVIVGLDAADIVRRGAVESLHQHVQGTPELVHGHLTQVGTGRLVVDPVVAMGPCQKWVN